jgi:hypothetical protein
VLVSLTTNSPETAEDKSIDAFFFCIIWRVYSFLKPISVEGIEKFDHIVNQGVWTSWLWEFKVGFREQDAQISDVVEGLSNILEQFGTIISLKCVEVRGN